ncbi:MULTISPECIES: ABC transporter permease [unclassified Dinoroseobacter]|uniref:ABC transporter permease n=1 Tax=unclassified Dinoroseobacter TaxID=2620028 RepID=UPI003C7D9BB8
MTDTSPPQTPNPQTGEANAAEISRFNRFDNPWFNPKLMWGVGILLVIILGGIIGRMVWNTELVFTGSTPLKLPPLGFENLRRQEGVAEFPLGTDGAGRDMLAMLIIGTPNTLMIGAIASIIGMSLGIFLGFSAGFVGGRVDDTIRVLSDVMITIPPLLILVVFQSAFGDVSLVMMAFLIAGFMWQSPTRLIRAQVLSMKRSGYVQMAQLSGASTFHIMFREMLPNLIPYLFGSFIANVTTAIVTAVGLEVLGLGPQRIPTLGRVIYDAINSGALIQNLWWWWGLPTALLATMFIALLLINLGLDEVSNPRLRKI